MTEYGHHIKKKSHSLLIDTSPEQMYPESRQERKKLIEAVMQRRREIYRKFFELLKADYEK